MPKAILEQKYKTVFKDRRAEFAIMLDCHYHAKTFDMLVYTGSYFVNSSINVCNWPVREWTLDQVKECLRIFYEEYIPCAMHLSPLVRPENLVEQSVNDEVVMGDAADLLWKALPNSTDEEDDMFIFTHIPYRDRLVVCDSIVDCGYIEDPFPFEGATNAFGEPTESHRYFYEKHLPSLMKLCQYKK
jgi:hypothetical protein